MLVYLAIVLEVDVFDVLRIPSVDLPVEWCKLSEGLVFAA